MRKLLISAALFSCAGFALRAQTFINSYTGSPVITDMKIADVNHNPTTGDAEAVAQRNFGYSLLNFDQYTGSVTSNYTVSTSSQWTPVATERTSIGNFVIATRTDGILWSSSAGGVTPTVHYTKLFANFFGNVTQLVPVDIAYDGSTYVYVLCKGTIAGNNSVTFVTFKVNATTGTPSQFSWLNTPANEQYVPNDIEYLNNDNVYVSGIHIDAFNVYKMYVGKLWNGPNPYIYTGSEFTYSVATATPAECYIKATSNAGGPVVYLVARMAQKNPAVMISEMNNTGAIYTVVNARQMNLGMTDITSVDYYNERIVVGGYLRFTSEPCNLLYNCVTDAPVSAHSYSLANTGSNSYAKSVYLPQQDRVFSLLCDAPGKTLHATRSHPNTTSGQACNNAVTWTELLPTITRNSDDMTVQGQAITPVNLSASTTFGSFYKTTLCSVMRLAGPATEDEAAVPSPTQVYPNPANDAVTIPNLDGILSTVMLFDLNGKLIRQEQVNEAGNYTLNVSDVDAGVYMLTLSYSNGSSDNQKLIITE